MSYDQLVSDPSTYVKKRTERQDDSILSRHMDNVVGTGPEEHLMSDFDEHMKTSLLFTDVVVLRNEGDAVKFWGSWDHQDKQVLRGEKQDRARGTFVCIFTGWNTRNRLQIQADALQ